MEQFKFFWRKESPFSNWYPCSIERKDKIFNCAEQAMMWEKAILFKDYAIASEILAEKDPSKHKALGRKINNFDVQKWDKVKYELVKDILRDKFSQNLKMRLELVQYKGFTLVEASPYDRIWGIGYDHYNALQNKESWGQNLLGKILTELATELF